MWFQSYERVTTSGVVFIEQQVNTCCCWCCCCLLVLPCSLNISPLEPAQLEKIDCSLSLYGQEEELASEKDFDLTLCNHRA